MISRKVDIFKETVEEWNYSGFFRLDIKIYKPTKIIIDGVFHNKEHRNYFIELCKKHNIKYYFLTRSQAPALERIQTNNE